MAKKVEVRFPDGSIRQLSERAAQIAVSNYKAELIQAPARPIELRKNLPPEITQAKPLKVEPAAIIKPVELGTKTAKIEPSQAVKAEVKQEDISTKFIVKKRRKTLKK